MLIKLTNTAFHGNLFGSFRDVAYGQTQEYSEGNRRTLATSRCKHAKNKNRGLLKRLLLNTSVASVHKVPILSPKKKSRVSHNAL
jgi:hypothetical protein